jgi:hypothetical protein
MNLGLLFRRRGDPAAAAREFEATLRLEPGYVRPWIELLGLVDAGTLRADHLREFLATWEPDGPDRTYRAMYRALLVQHGGEHARALPLLRNALEGVDPRRNDGEPHALLRLALGLSLLEVGRRREAISVLTELATDAYAAPRSRAAARSLLGSG